MRWTPIVAYVVVVVIAWAVALKLVQRGRSRSSRATERERRSDGLQNTAVVCATTGLTVFVLWLATDAKGPHWLHALAQPVALLAIGIAAVVSGLSAWVRVR
jgi:uncharacterized membrane protein